jgi:hypothetical protein
MAKIFAEYIIDHLLVEEPINAEELKNVSLERYRRQGNN